MGWMEDPADSDEALMRRYTLGDVAAFDILYRRHEMRIWRYLERHTGNRATADELMQEVWFAVARDAARYVPSARFTTWLFTIAHHRVIDSVRTRRRETSLDPDAPIHVVARWPRQYRLTRPGRSSGQFRSFPRSSAMHSCCR
jgi:DNA-directed RNA polymerase specialized sigma24 family protein